MAIPLAGADLLQTRTVTVQSNQIGMNIRYWRVSNLVGAVTMEQAVAAIDAQMSIVYLPCMSNNAVYRGMGMRRLSPNATLEISSIANAAQGTSAADCLPTNVCGLITLRTAFPGRKFRGRIYMPFPSEAANDLNGLPTAAHQTALANVALMYQAPFIVTVGINTATLQPVLKHRDATPPTDLGVSIVRAKWGQQHRRGDFGRPNVLPF